MEILEIDRGKKKPKNNKHYFQRRKNMTDFSTKTM